MSYRIALNFEDGITRFVECRPGETVADASYRVEINIPLDCRDGACGTCKGFCETGDYDNGAYIEDAMTEEEAEEGYILACQMRPSSDCVVRIAATSNVCKTGVSTFKGHITTIDHLSETTTSFSMKLEAEPPLTFLPGQYVESRHSGQGRAKAILFIQFVAPRIRGLVPHPQYQKRASPDLYARTCKGGRSARVHWTRRQLLSARNPEAFALSRRRNRTCAVSRDA